MTDISKVVLSPESRSQEADAATDALVRFTQSAKEFLSYQRIYAEGAQASKALSLKEAEVKEKDGKIKELESAIAVWTHRGHEEVTRMESERNKIVKEKSDLDVRLRQALAGKGKVQTQVEKTERLLDGKAEELARLQKDVLALKAREEELKTTLSKEIAAKENIAEQLHTTRAKLGEYAGYTADLVDLNLNNFSKNVANVWKRTNALVERYFSLDISTESSQEHDTWAQHVCSVIRPPSGSILIPPTNTSAAKFARKAAMLNVFALVFAQWIFTVTPPSLAQVGLDAILSELTDQDEKKEQLCRAILNSVSSGNAPEHKELQQLAKSVTETSGILFSSKLRTEMKSDVKNLIAEASDCWAASRRSHRKLIATLDYESYPDSWTNYPAPSHRRRQDSKNIEASDPEDEEEVAYVAFPAIIARRRCTWETIFPGILMRYSHLLEAEDEWRKEQKKRRFSRSGVPNNISGLPSSRLAPNSIM